MDIPRSTAIAAPAASNAPAVIPPTKQSPRKEKSENVKCVLCDGNTQLTIKDALSIKTYRKETSHLYEVNR